MNAAGWDLCGFNIMETFDAKNRLIIIFQLVLSEERTVLYAIILI